MNRLSSRRWQIVLYIVLSLFVSSACLILAPRVPPTPTSTPASTSSASTPDPKVLAALAQGGTPLPVQGDAAGGPGAFNLPDPKVGLADLSSYKASLMLSFTGTRDGKNQQWSKTYVMLNVKQPAVRQLTLAKSGDNSDPDPVFMAQAGGVAYERHGTNGCVANLVDPAKSPIGQLEPAGFLGSISGADAAGSQTVNSVTADHYTFDERALGELGIETSSGEMWVAAKGSYIVKYTLTTKGDANYFGDGIVGTLTWDYELMDANQPVTIQLPTDCPPGLVNAPQLPDASNIRNVPASLTYDTSSSLADAAAFYQKQIPGLGWKMVGDPAITDTTVLLSFTQDTQELTVVITKTATGTKVHLLLGMAQP